MTPIGYKQAQQRVRSFKSNPATSILPSQPLQSGGSCFSPLLLLVEQNFRSG